jgi:hypothetical protein
MLNKLVTNFISEVWGGVIYMEKITSTPSLILHTMCKTFSHALEFILNWTKIY